jgi:hypothetical protein
MTNLKFELLKNQNLKSITDWQYCISVVFNSTWRSMTNWQSNLIEIVGLMDE